MKSLILRLLLCASVCAPLAAQRATRAHASQSVNRNTNVNANRNTNVNANRNVNVNQNVNVNVNRNVNVHGGYYGGGCCYHPVATAAAVTATAMVTAAVIGSVTHSLPPACTAVMMGGIAYQQCGSTWYQPQFAGGNTTYIVVNPPN